MNGIYINKFWIKHSELVKGGKLVLEMGSEPNKNWAATSEHPQAMDIDPIVTTPYIRDTEKIFLEDNLVKLVCDTKGTVIYYTTDGSKPNRNSTIYKKPFLVHETTTINMRAYKGEKNSLASLAVIKKVELSEPIHLEKVKKGLTYKYYHGSFRMVNDFVNLPPIQNGTVGNFSITPRQKEQFFAFDYDGYINIPDDGIYTFYLATNDGGRLYIDDFSLINNDGLHPLTEVKEPLALKSGLHPISVKYFQEGGSYGLTVSWKGPKFEKQEIPSYVLFHEEKN